MTHKHKKRISPKWAEVAISVLGDKNGQHCHWCKYIKHEDGYSFCTHPQSKFNDDDRIRSWDGLECAKECGCFKLDDWYTKDKNYEKYFGKKI